MSAWSEVKGYLGRNLITKEWLEDPELIKARLSKCKSCKNYDANEDTCKICKCIIAVKTEAKVNRNYFELRLEETHCPVGKWPIRQDNGEVGGNDLEIANYYRELSGKKKL